MRNKFIPVIICSLLITYSCQKKQLGGSSLKSVFNYSVSGFIVTFTNFTDFNNYTGPYAAYKWDFGDGDTSDVNSPSHIYTRVGKFVVTLTATKGNQVSSFFDTVNVTGPHIIIDGNLSDWDYVPWTYISPDSTGGSDLLALKTFASVDSLYFYIEGTSNMFQFATNMYFNTDNNPQSGYITGTYPVGSGADYCYEGDLYYWGWTGNYTGSGGNWGWNTSVAGLGIGTNFSKISVLPNGHNAIEFSFARSVLGNVKDSLGFAINDLNSGWSVIGAIPQSALNTSKFLEIGQ